MSTIERRSFEDIKRLVAENNVLALARSPDIDIKYKDHRVKVLEEWVSIEDSVKVKYLGALYLDQDGRKKAYFPDSSSRYALAYNDFPYYIDESLDHYVLWATHRLSPDEVEKILDEKIGLQPGTPEGSLGTSHERYWFEQTVNFKSVKGVWHVHVFVYKLTV